MNYFNIEEYDKIKRDLRRLGFKEFKLEKIKKGVNSKIYKISNHRNNLILKVYPKMDFLKRKRIENEYNFLNLLIMSGYKNIPKPLGWDFKQNWMLMSFLDGEHIKKVKKIHYEKLIKFIFETQSLKKNILSKKLTNASEASFNIFDHYKLIKQRVNIFFTRTRNNYYLNSKNIKNLNSIENDINSNLDLIYKNELVYLSDYELNKDINLNQRIISQSDIGFHNIFEDKNRNLLFFDFEYAGWDDPGKLFSDLVLHPDHKIPFSLFHLLNSYLDNFIFGKGYKKERLNLILSLYRLKWILIILNPILKNMHSTDINHLSELKLKKAKNYMEESKIRLIAHKNNISSILEKY